MSTALSVLPEILSLPEEPPTLRERVMLDKVLRKHPQYREQIKERCAEDIAFFINAFGFTFDPRETSVVHDIPFILYDYQINALQWFEERLAQNQDGIVEKSRDMGVTWITLVWLVHKWLFKDGFQALIGSRKEDLVDNWTLDSHFGKIAYFVEHLPKWLLPKGFNPAVHRMKLKLVNPENGNVIIGESANSNFSRQGRYTVILFDEAAFWENLEESFRAAAGASPCRLLISTPNGAPEINTFAELRYSNRYPILTLHFSLHPLKDAAWERVERQRMSLEDAAQELDIDYHRSARGLVYPAFANIHRGEYPHEKGWTLFTGWDFGIQDDTAIWWISRDPTDGKLRLVDYYSNNNQPIDFYVPFILGYLPEDNTYTYAPEELEMIFDHAYLPRAMHYGDPDVHKRSLASGTSSYQVLADHGIVILTNTKIAQDYGERKRKTELGIKRIEGVNYPHCKHGFEGVANARFPPRKSSSQSTSAISKPIHDWTEAPRSALEYFFVNEPPFFEEERPAPRRKTMAYDTIT